MQLAPIDPPLPGLMGDERLTRPAVVLGSSLDRCIQGNPQLLLLLLATFRYTHYMILPARGAIHVILHHSANSRDICQAFMQVCQTLNSYVIDSLMRSLQDLLIGHLRLTTHTYTMDTCTFAAHYNDGLQL